MGILNYLGLSSPASQAQQGPTPNPQPDQAAGTSKPQTNTSQSQSLGGQVSSLLASDSGASTVGLLNSYLNAPGVNNAKFTFAPNVLWNYANYTYHIRWSLTGDKNAALVQSAGSSAYANNGKIIIAESGATALYNITEFKFTNLLPGNPSTATNDLKMEMTVVEPYGCTLVDNLFNTAQSLGIGNYFTTTSYFIEIWFTGYNEDGTVATTDLHSKQYKLYMVQVIEIDIDTTESGTTYHITLLPQNMFPLADSVGIMSNAANIGPVATVGEFFTKLADVWTAQNAALYGGKARIIYKINTPNWMKTWQFSQAPTDNQRNSNIDIIGGNLQKPTISIARGMDLVSILNFVMSMTTDGQNFTAGEPTSASTSATAAANIRINGMANRIVIKPVTKLLTPIDPQTKDYVRQVTYNFFPFATNRLLIDQKTAEMTRQPTQQIPRKQSLANSLRFAKRYFWTYTGQNLDVLKYELKLKMSAQIGIANNLGHNLYDNFTSGPQFNAKGVSTEELLKYNTLKGNLQNAQQQLSTTSDPTQRQYYNQQIQDYNQQRNQLTSRYPGTNFDQLSANQTIAGQSTAQAEAQAKAAENTATQASNNVTNQSLNLANTAVTLLRETKYLEDIANTLSPASPVPISTRVNPMPTQQNAALGGSGQSENATSSENPANLPPNRSLVASILYEATQTSYANIDLSIRGDPFWLGLGNIDEDFKCGDGNSPTPNTTDALWPWNGDTGFLFTLRTGTAYNEQTGFMDLNDTTLVWNAFYTVIKVESLFKDGQFTQTLHGIRDNLTQAPQPSEISNNVPNNAQAVAAQAKLTAANAFTSVTGQSAY